MKRSRPPLRDLRGPAPEPSYWAHAAGQAGLPKPGDAEWTHARDRHVIVAGLDVVARRQIVEETVRLLEHSLKTRSPERWRELMRLWGTLAATEILRRQTKGGKRTWGARGQRPGLLSLIDDLDKPPGLEARRAVLDSIRVARRAAIDGLLDFTVDLEAEALAGLQQKALNPQAYPARRGLGTLSAAELHRRVLSVCRFYGIAEPTWRKNGPRTWRLYLWRVTRIHFQMERYHDVRLASLDWLPPNHFDRWLGTERRSA